MLRIDISWVIDTFKSIEQLSVIQAGVENFPAWATIFDAQKKVEALFSQSVYSTMLRTSRRHADSFVDEIQPILSALANPDEEGRALNQMEAYQLREAAKRLKLVLLADLSVVPAFLVTQKANYSTDHLIDNGLGLFPTQLIDKAPETFDDAQEVGKCLAYELSTACGFHTFRVVESVLRRYWDEVARKDRPKNPSLGVICKALSENKLGDEKVIESLAQLAKLHRNPLAHPDVILTLEEAISTVGMASSVITHMLNHLPNVPPTTSQ